MNIAFLLVGEFRWFESSHRTFKENFLPTLQDHNVKYFGHFWKNDDQYLEEFKNIYNPIIYKLEDQKPFEEIKNYFNNNNNLSGNLLSQTYSFYRSFLLLKEYQEEHNINFDLYIKMRCDLAFLEKVDLDKFDDNSIYVKDIAHWRPLSNYINDYIFFTKKYDNVKNMAEMGFNFNNLLKQPESFIYQKDESKGIYCPEEILAKHLIDKNINTKTYNFNIDLARYHK